MEHWASWGAHLIEHAALERPWDAVVVAAGTEATAAELLLGLKGTANLYVANALKGFDMGPAIQHQLNLALNDSTWSKELADRCTWNDAHLGGSAIPESLQSFIVHGGETGVPLDGVYTGKALRRLEQAWREDPDWSGRRVLFIHTGRLRKPLVAVTIENISALFKSRLAGKFAPQPTPRTGRHSDLLQHNTALQCFD